MSGPVWVVVVAAGTGTRFGGAKQFASLQGRPLVQWAVDAAREISDGIVLVLGESDIASGASTELGAHAVVAGGSTRSASVRAGMAAVPQDAGIIVVHDGARPLASPDLFRRVVNEVRSGAEAVAPALAVTDTLKRVRDDEVVGAVPRDEVFCVQTPQAFRAELLRKAHEDQSVATDDTALVEALGATVRIVPGEPRNLKVTTQADLDLVSALAKG